MNTVNPALASATQSLYTQNNGLADNTAKEPKISDKTTAANSTSGGTTVTLSDQVRPERVDYRDLASSQTVNANTPVEDTSVEANRTTNDETNQNTNNATYVANLQSQANYLASQETEI